jgi:hypothetical protein
MDWINMAEDRNKCQVVNMGCTKIIKWWIIIFQGRAVFHGASQVAVKVLYPLAVFNRTKIKPDSDYVSFRFPNPLLS